MGILDWFKTRPVQFERGQEADAELLKAIDKAVTLTNPLLKLVHSYQEALKPAVKTSSDYLREAMLGLPPAIPVSEAQWSSVPELKAFFAAAADVPDVLSHSINLRTLFDKFPNLDEAYFILNMQFQERHTTGMSLEGGAARGDASKTVVSFSDHQARICGQEDAEVRHLLGTQAFEYLVAQALAEIGEGRSERRELEDSRSLIQSRLRLLRQQGPGLGSVLNAAPANGGEQRRLESELLDNERQMEALGSQQAVLETELQILCEVLLDPERFVHIDRTQLRLDPMNIVVDQNGHDPAAEIVFSLAQLTGRPAVQRAFVIGRIARPDLRVARMNLDKMGTFL